MLLSAYAMLAGKSAIAAMAIVGWCCWAMPTIIRVVGNPELTLAARRQMIMLALFCIIPLLGTVILISFGKNDEVCGQMPLLAKESSAALATTYQCFEVRTTQQGEYAQALKTEDVANEGLAAKLLQHSRERRRADQSRMR